MGQTAVQSPLAPTEICSSPHPSVSPNISNRHRPAAPCPHHPSVPAPAPLINDDLCWRDRGLRDRGYRAGNRDRCWCFDHPQFHSATLWQAWAAVQEVEREEVERGGSDLQVQGQWRRVISRTSWKCHTVRCQRTG